MDHPEVKKALSDLKVRANGGEIQETEAKNLFSICDDHAFLWTDHHPHLICVNLNPLDKDNRVQHFELTSTPLFEVEHVTPSPTGRWILLRGRRGVTCVELPRRSGKGGRFAGGKREVTCRAIEVGESVFAAKTKLVVQQASWHPGSALDSHVVILSSDSYLRIFNVETDHETPEQSINLSVTSKESFFGESSLSVRASLGETAVGFAFAPPVTDEVEDNEFDQDVLLKSKWWPMFILHGNGEIFCLVTALGEFKLQNAKPFGPLPMFPESPDNYGVDSCSILCLHPLISCPPILVIATSGGTLYHCVVLNKSIEEESIDLETESQVSQWSRSTLQDPQISLYVYEMVELEIGMSTRPDLNKSNQLRPFDYPMLLQHDPSSPARYFCSHKAGVHCIGLPMVTHLAELTRRPDQQAKHFIPKMDEDSVVEHLVCTQMAPHTTPAPILGIAIHYPPSVLFCLLQDYQVVQLALSAPAFGAPPPLGGMGDSRTRDSPIRSKFEDKEPFEQRIRIILKKKTTLPKLKAGDSVDLTSQDCLDIVSRSTQILREEYLVRLETARAEIEKRVEVLRRQRMSQMSELAKLSSEKHNLREKAADLSELYEDFKDRGQNLQTRVELVLQKLQRSLNRTAGESDAEIRMQRQIKDLEKKTKDMSNSIEQIRVKERYQNRQVSESRNSRRGVTTSNTDMGDNQLLSIKEVLEKDSKDISDMVKTLNLAKRDLAV